MPGITNPAEEYFKDGLWAWAATLWEKLISSGGRLFTALHGWDGAAWRKLPLVFGYSDAYADSSHALNVPAGDAYVDYSGPAVGEIWVVKTFSVRPKQANASFIWLIARIGGKHVTLKAVTSWTALDSVDWDGEAVLENGDYLRYRYEGATLNDDFYSTAAGYKMKIAE